MVQRRQVVVEMKRTVQDEYANYTAEISQAISQPAISHTGQLHCFLSLGGVHVNTGVNCQTELFMLKGFKLTLSSISAQRVMRS